MSSRSQYRADLGDLLAGKYLDDVEMAIEKARHSALVDRCDIDKLLALEKVIDAHRAEFDADCWRDDP